MLRPIILLCKVFFILNFLTFVPCESSYTIVSPGNIRPNRKFTVSATLHNVDQPAKFIIGIKPYTDWSKNQSVVLQPFETKLVHFYPPKISTFLLRLFVEGVQGLYFKNSTIISVSQKECLNIYIETDRGAYKPGDLVWFRIVILDELAKPVKIREPVKVHIYDSSENRVKQFKDITLNQGVYTNNFQLSKEPLLGSWSIKAHVGGKYAQEKSVVFEVAKYVLPKFFVNIEAENDFSLKNRFLKIKVFGRYTFNKPVEGLVILNVTRNFYDEFIPIANFTSETVNNDANFEIDLSDLTYHSFITDFLIVNASLVEQETGIIQSVTKIIYLYHQAYRIDMLYKELEFKNDKPYLIKVKIHHWNSTAIVDPEKDVFMTKGGATFKTKLNADGVATFENDFNNFEEIRISYKDNSREFLIPSATGENSKRGCELKVQNLSFNSNSTIDVAVKYEQNISYLVYMLTAHGNIIKSELVRLSPEQNSYTIQLMPSLAMMPVSYLFVHYIFLNKLHSCELKIELPEKLENELSISAPRNLKPGEDITMTINAQPGSRVAITAVDLSSLLLKTRNRIEKANIFRTMREDISYTFESRIQPGKFSGLSIITDAYYSSDFLSNVGYLRPTPGVQAENSFRSYFPETWIFLDLNITNEISNINFTLPDTITTWFISAFSINENTGIGFLNEDVTITTFKPFFITTYLPYSIKRGEIVSIPVVIFNYHSQSLKTEVTMENKLNEFQFIDDVTDTTTDAAIEKRLIIIPANSGKSVNFLIKPQKLGHIDIWLEAKNEVSSDKVLQKLLVEGSGLANSYNHELYIHLESGQNYTNRFKPNIPTEIEPDTEFLQLSIGGNILLPSLDNIDNLVDKPTGCGEQNMINFAPNVLVLEYLSATRQKSKYSELAEKARNYIEVGYQQELKFLHSNGGYSVFGPRVTKTPSNWLTAYVVRFFIKALKYYPIETKIIDRSLKFLVDTQLSSGEFPNGGYLFHPVYQNRHSFTAFVLLSFLENAKYAKKYKTVVQKAINFLTNDINDIDDIYSLAIMAAVLQIAKHKSASDILDKLKPMAKTENDQQWWHDTRDTDDGSADVEITSYILLALLHTPGHYLPIAKWLMEQRNSHGGFESTQDTVVGIQALTKFAESMGLQNSTMIKVLYTAVSGGNEEIEKGILGLDPDNAEVMQHYELPSSTRSLDIEISGTGSIFLQFSYNYRTPFRAVRSSALMSLSKTFVIKKTAASMANELSLNLEICFQYKPQEDVKYFTTNMIIVEVDLLSGFIANEEQLAVLRSREDIDRVEDENPGKLIFYFTSMEADEEKCIDLIADNKHHVKNLKPSKIIVYEYYHSDRREVVMYDIEK